MKKWFTKNIQCGRNVSETATSIAEFLNKHDLKPGEYEIVTAIRNTLPFYALEYTILYFAEKVLE